MGWEHIKHGREESNRNIPIGKPESKVPTGTPTRIEQEFLNRSVGCRIERC